MAYNAATMTETMTMIDQALIDSANSQLQQDLQDDYDALGGQLARRGIDIETITEKVAAFNVAIPSWGVGTGGTRFARFPLGGEPRHIFDKLDDCSVIQQLSRCTPTVSPHFPWDKVSDYQELKQHAQNLGLGFDAVNSNTFQDQSEQTHSYKFGSLSHSDKATREQAVEHNIECIEIGKKLGSKAITVWIADGSNFPGQHNFADAFRHYLDSMRQVYAALPADWRVFIEHKFYEPAFYSTVINDWGSNYIAATELGSQAQCLVDLGHHAPNVNIEQIVSRLAQFGKLGGFHFNDSKYGDDDLDTGSINPYQLFLVFNELIEAENRYQNFDPAYMLDQSHNVTDPIESLICSAIEVQRCYAQALLVNREQLAAGQQNNDAIQTGQLLKRAYTSDVHSILAMARFRANGAIDPIAAYRDSGYRQRLANIRPTVSAGGGGIV